MPGVEDMSGVNICGAASILTEPGIGTVQTPASTEHVDGTVAGGFSEAGERHPALTTSAVSMTKTAEMPRKCWKLCGFFSDMGYLINGNN
jgi:hypothetical protein